MKNFRNALAEETKKQFNKMEEKGILKIISRKGIGKYIGDYGKKDSIRWYEKYVQIYRTTENKYFVGIFENPLSEKIFDEECLYEGINFSKAKEVFDEVVQKDLNKKANKVHKIFGRN